MIDWSSHYESELSIRRVLVPTWADTGRVAGLLSASVERDCDGDAPELESGAAQVVTDPSQEWQDGIYRLVMTAHQDGITERVDVATMHCLSDSGSVERGADYREVTCLSVLHPASVNHIVDGEYVPKGTNAAAKCAEWLGGCILAPVSVEGSFALAEHWDVAPGTTVLEAVWELLGVGGFCIQIDGSGTVHIVPKPADPALVLDRAAARLLFPEVSHETPLSQAKSRYVAIENGVKAVAENQALFESRGYWDEVYDDSPSRLDGETLQAYANRRLEEEGTVEDVREYSRRFFPGVLPYSIVRGSMASVKLDGDMRVKSQTVNLDHGINITERAAREVKTWTA